MREELKPEERKQVSIAFNNMTFEQRKIASNAEFMVRINDLETQKKRLRENYEREMEYLNGKISGYSKAIKTSLNSGSELSIKETV